MKDAPLSGLLIQSSIDNDNQLMIFSYSIWWYLPDTGRNKGAYIIFYQGGTIDHGTHVSLPFARPSAKSEYNAACAAVMALARFRMLIHEIFSKDQDKVPEEALLIILYSK